MRSQIEKHKDNTYLNIVINPLSSLGARDTPAVYDENLTIPVLSNPSEYYCSVIRFSLPLDTIPILKFPVDVSQNNPNVSYLVFGIRNALGTMFSEQVIFTPTSNLTAPTPAGSAPFFTNQQAVSDYYNIFSIRAMVNMFNAALSAAVTASGLGVASPYYTYDPNTELFSLTVPQAFQATAASIYMNKYAKNFLSSFEFFFDSTTFVDDYLYYHVLTYLPPLVGTNYIFYEDYISVALWFDLRKIVITSTTLPVNPESVPSQNPNDGGRTNGLVSYNPIITDYIIAFDLTNQIQTVAVYNPTSQYRLVDMSSNSPLNKINLAFYYYDKFGNQFPVYVSPSQQISIKLGFFRKELYNTHTLGQK